MLPVTNASGNVALFTVENGQTRLWHLHLKATWRTGGTAGGAGVTVKVNGEELLDQEEGLRVAVSEANPTRENAKTTVLSDGDVVTAFVDGDPCDLELRGFTPSEDL